MNVTTITLGFVAVHVAAIGLAGCSSSTSSEGAPEETEDALRIDGNGCGGGGGGDDRDGGGNGGNDESRLCDEHGTFANISTAGHIDTRNEFFKSLGTNGRACSTCHVPADGFGLGTQTAQALFDRTGGGDALFRPVDGANNPNADVSTLEARRKAYSLLLARGTIRIALALPDTAEFTVDAIDDPYGAATTTNLSLYRRPLMATNLKFGVPRFVMWDGREPSFASQANNATLSHAEATAPLTAEQQQHIVDFETSLFTAQTTVRGLGDLRGVGGGPEALSQQPFAFNTNAPQAPPTPPVTRTVFTMFADWTTSSDPAKQAVVRGQDIFNNRVFGSGPPPLRAPMTCTLCHSSINVGNNDHSGADGGSIQATGTSGEGPLAFPNSAQFLSPDLPTYTLKNKTTLATLRSNDPGRALVTGKWNDIGRFKTPNLRGLSARAPYFHNGMAKTLLDVVNFYDKGKAVPSGLGFTDQEKADLAAFLTTL